MIIGFQFVADVSALFANCVAGQVEAEGEEERWREEVEEDGETEAAITARKFAKCGNNNNNSAANRSQIVANMEISRCPIEAAAAAKAAAAGAAVISIWLQIGGRKGVIKVLALVPDEDSQCRQ